ncbi:hypothetical protein [Massilia cavernae]|uniref:Uncharacterized protein n=1 Tax=Massilia cavernae TaxID=2320864 RepID=A0A418XH01_9BURK|nr:hypothetical protein [Massilia cavernae]RJG11750.1 hypothetical protein D3872_18085 [Massilia cavernae]
MKYVIVLAVVFLLLSSMMGRASKKGKLNEQANKAVTGLANAMRYLVYALMIVMAIALVIFTYHEFM